MRTHIQDINREENNAANRELSYQARRAQHEAQGDYRKTREELDAIAKEVYETWQIKHLAADTFVSGATLQEFYEEVPDSVIGAGYPGAVVQCCHFLIGGEQYVSATGFPALSFQVFR